MNFYLICDQNLNNHWSSDSYYGVSVWLRVVRIVIVVEVCCGVTLCQNSATDAVMHCICLYIDSDLGLH